MFEMMNQWNLQVQETQGRILWETMLAQINYLQDLNG